MQNEERKKKRRMESIARARKERPCKRSLVEVPQRLLQSTEQEIEICPPTPFHSHFDTLAWPPFWLGPFAFRLLIPSPCKR